MLPQAPCRCSRTRKASMSAEIPPIATSSICGSNALPAVGSIAGTSQAPTQRPFSDAKMLNIRTHYRSVTPSNDGSFTEPPASPSPATGRLYDHPANCCCIVCDSMGPSTYESVGASEVNSRSKLAVSFASTWEQLVSADLTN